MVANGDSSDLCWPPSPMVTGQFIYHGCVCSRSSAMAAYDSGMYAYGIYRNRDRVGAFEAAGQSPDRQTTASLAVSLRHAAFVARHDFENDTGSDSSSIEASAQAESITSGAKGDYYFTTGADPYRLRRHAADECAEDTSHRQLCNGPSRITGRRSVRTTAASRIRLNTSSARPTEYDYWHWGPGRSSATQPPSGYANGKAYAYTSILASFSDIKGWLSGLDNGRAGCGVANNCPNTWVSPAFNSTREDSYDVLQQLDAITAGEQKIGPFPHSSLSTRTAGKRYPAVTLPVSDWYVGTNVAQSMDTGGHTVATVRARLTFTTNLAR